jgi:hypothetical protein
MYRIPGRVPAKRGLSTIATYLDPIEAQMARARLEAAGIDAIVIEPTGFNPLLTAAAGGIQLQVPAAEADRAQSVLDEPDVVTEHDDDGEGEGVVRCPRCELAYVSFGRPPIRTAPVPGLALVYAVRGALMPKRWYCEKCDHVWTDPEEGPRAMTPLGADAPRPVFRLTRAHPGMGLFVGFLSGMGAGAMVGDAPGALLWVGLTLGGYVVGRSIKGDFCSEPGCRAPLEPAADECRRCKGTIAGVVRQASHHYSAAADVRRELAAIELAPRRRKKTRSRTA